MTERLKKAVIGIAALVALALGGAALAQAGGSGDSQKGNQAEQRSERAANQAGDNDNVQFEGEDGDEGEAREEGEGEVTGSGADEAKAAALKSTGGGQAGSVERDSENGAVWEVEVTKPDGKIVDVRLDEGYKVIATEGDTEDNE